MSFRTLAWLLLLIPALSGANSDLVKKPSKYDVSETIDRLENLAKENGMTVFARIDHHANAESIGKSMPYSQVLIFGAPKAGTRIMLHDLASGLDLPLRVLAYTDYDGNTWIVYHNPQGLKQSYDVQECKILDQIEAAVDRLTDRAAGE